MRSAFRKVFAGIFLVAAGGSAGAQVVMLAETTWGPNPATGVFPMGAFDSQVVPFFNPLSPPVAAVPPCVPVVGAAPPGVCGATLWHAEIDCCAAGAGFALPMTAPVAAYNTGPPAFNYNVPAAVANRGAIASVGIGGVPLRPTEVSSIVLSFDEIRSTEPGPGNFNSFDKGFVEVRSAPCGEPPCPDPAGTAWTILAQVVGLQGCAAPVTCSIGPADATLDATFIGGSGKIRFRFETVDGASNTYCGWMVDNVLLTNEKCNPSCPGIPSPRIGSVGGMPRPGNAAFGISLTGAPPGAIALLFLGLARLDPPLPLGAIFPGSPCIFCCSPDVLLGTAVTSTAGGAALPIPIPAALAPCSGPVCVQWAILGGGGVLLSSSKGDITIQP